jgi:hypothetical protein
MIDIYFILKLSFHTDETFCPFSCSTDGHYLLDAGDDDDDDGDDDNVP